MPARVKPINLLPPTDFEVSFWGKFLKWAVSAGRYIIIVTELVVIMAFLSRFKLDQDVADLASTLEGERNVLEAQSTVEKEFNLTQTRLASADTMLNSQLGARAKIDMVTSHIPTAVKLTSLTVDGAGVTVLATTLSEQALGEMLVGISQDEKVKGVEISDIESNDLVGINITFTVKL